MIVSQIKQVNNLPSEFLVDLPETCDCCGYPLDIDLTLTTLRCPNKFCNNKIQSRVERIKRELNITDTTKIDPYDYMSILSKSQFKDFTVLEYIKLASLPILNDNVLNSILREVDNLEEFYKELNIDILINDEDIDLDTINIFDNLITYKEVLLKGLQYINIISDKDTIYIKEITREEAMKLGEKLNKHIGIDKTCYDYINADEVR